MIVRQILNTGEAMLVELDQGAQALATELERFSQSGDASPGWHRVEVSLEPLNALAWLSKQSLTDWLYWRGADEALEIAGLGAALEFRGESGEDLEDAFSSMRAVLDGAPDAMRFFGGMRFNPEGKVSPEWERFSAFRFHLPRFELRASLGSTLLACNFLVTDAGPQLEKIWDDLQKLEFSEAEGPQGPLRLRDRENCPDFPSWAEGLETAFKLFEEGLMEKVVLARRVGLQLSHRLCPAQVLRLAKPEAEGCFLFCFSPEPGSAFLGASPERLFCRHGDVVQSQAVAGTRRRGTGIAEDVELGNELLDSEKDVREHSYVCTHIQQVFEGCCTQVDRDPRITLLKRSRYQHLFCRFEGRLKEGAEEAKLLKDLHPTPAVGGTPAELAQEKISRIEGFDRGWYSGPVGWIGKNSLDFAVAIRSGLLEENRLLAYSGAGIVEGSKFREEWDEIELKIGHFLSLIKGG